MIIKIDRASIKKNPRAGATVTMMQGHREATFMFPSGGKIPANLVDKVEIIEWEGAARPEDGIHLRGYITNPDDWRELTKVPGIVISVDNGLQPVYHFPEPAYLYKRENPTLTCSNCQAAVLASDISNDAMDDGDGGEIFIDQMCPICGAYDTFGDIEYEEIEAVVAELKL